MDQRSAAGLVRYLARIRQRTERVVALVPPDRIEWRPAPGAFSFGDLLRHLAAIDRYTFAENLRGRPSTYPGHRPELAAGYEEVMSFWRRLRAESFALIEELTDEQLRSSCTTPGGADLPAWKWLRAMIEHEVHHRGQIYLMLRLCGVETPPLYGLTSEEVAARSG